MRLLIEKQRGSNIAMEEVELEFADLIPYMEENVFLNGQDYGFLIFNVSEQVYNLMKSKDGKSLGQKMEIDHQCQQMGYNEMNEHAILGYCGHNNYKRSSVIIGDSKIKEGYKSFNIYLGRDKNYSVKKMDCKNEMEICGHGHIPTRDGFVYRDFILYTTDSIQSILKSALKHIDNFYLVDDREFCDLPSEEKSALSMWSRIRNPITKQEAFVIIDNYGQNAEGENS